MATVNRTFTSRIAHIYLVTDEMQQTKTYAEKGKTVFPFESYCILHGSIQEKLHVQEIPIEAYNIVKWDDPTKTIGLTHASFKSLYAHYAAMTKICSKIHISPVLSQHFLEENFTHGATPPNILALVDECTTLDESKIVPYIGVNRESCLAYIGKNHSSWPFVKTATEQKVKLLTKTGSYYLNCYLMTLAKETFAKIQPEIMNLVLSEHIAPYSSDKVKQINYADIVFAGFFGICSLSKKTSTGGKEKKYNYNMGL